MAVNHDEVDLAEAKRHNANAVLPHPDKPTNMMPDASHLRMIEEQQNEDAIQSHMQAPYSRRVLNNKTKFQDITAKFRSAASGLSIPSSLKRIITHRVTGLKTGQLVKDAHFTLFEAVGALEVNCHCHASQSAV